MIPYGRQSINEDDINAVCKVLVSDYLTQGPCVDAFEKAVADYCGAKYAVAVNSATSALHIACLAAGLGAGDIMWTSPNTFVASANCGLYCGSSVDFVDIDPDTYNMSTTSLDIKLKKAAESGRIPKIIIPVHFAGQSCDMLKISESCKKNGIRIIEDASHAIGGEYINQKIGSCHFSDMTVFSFHPVKIITTGEGGMVLTNNKELYNGLLRLRSHGITRDEKLMSETSHGPWYYQQLELGYNFRMTDIQAALGLSQLGRLDEFVNKRKELAEVYNKRLADLPIKLPFQNRDSFSSWHLYVVRLDLKRIKKSRKEIFEKLRDSGVGVNVHYIPVHTQPYYKKFGFGPGDFPESEKYYSEAITIPLYPDLTENQQNEIITAIQEALL